jgi:hypothetical protein
MADAARDLLLEEYQAAQDTYLRYDSFRVAGWFLPNCRSFLILGPPDNAN